MDQEALEKLEDAIHELKGHKNLAEIPRKFFIPHL